MKEKLYIVYKLCSDIHVYDENTFAHLRKIPVEGLNIPWDIAAHANVLYVSEFKHELIHRIQLSDGNVSNWSVESQGLRISVTKKGNVLVSCYLLNKIIEYTSMGTLVREIFVNAFDSTIVGLQHSIQMDDDRFIICHTEMNHQRVCIIDSAGRPLRSYGGPTGPGLGQLDGPFCLAIYRNAHILVADCNNNRIIQLNSSLEFIKEFIPKTVELAQPLRIHLLEVKGRLYVIEGNEQSIAIFDLHGGFPVPSADHTET